MSELLSKYVASLSKYIAAQKHFELLASIINDTPSTQVRAEFGDNLYATAKARYLTVDEEMVRRDRLIDLVHDEGSFTEQVKTAP